MGVMASLDGTAIILIQCQCRQFPHLIFVTQVVAKYEVWVNFLIAFMGCQFICEQWERRGEEVWIPSASITFCPVPLIFPPQLELYRKHYSARNYREPRKISPSTQRIKKKCIGEQELIGTTLKVSFLRSPFPPECPILQRGPCANWCNK